MELNKCGESGHPGIISDLRGKAFNLLMLKYDVSCRFVVYGFYYVEVCFFCTQFVDGYNFYCKNFHSMVIFTLSEL